MYVYKLIYLYKITSLKGLCKQSDAGERSIQSMQVNYEINILLLIQIQNLFFFFFFVVYTKHDNISPVGLLLRPTRVDQQPCI